MSPFDKIYAKSPIFIQEIGVSIFAFKRELKRSGITYKKYLKFLMKSYYWDESVIEEYQLNQTKEIIEWCQKHSLYYKKVLSEVNASSLVLSDMKNIPILKKEDLRNHFNEILTSQKNINLFFTSGTSGAVLKTALSNNEWAKEYAFIWRQRKLAGINRSDKLATFGGRNIVAVGERKIFWRRNYINNQLLFSAYHMNEENLSSYIKKYNEWKPDYVQGFPSSIHILAKYAFDNSLSLHKPKAIFTSSETLLLHQKQVIESVFKVEIYDYYGSTERAGIITQCTEGNYHVNIESGLLEVVDGRFYWTSFLNKTTPMIRYDIGDTGDYKILNKRCECGTCFPIINQLSGRVGDYIITKDGRELGRLSHMFKDNMNIKEVQIVQDIIGEITIRIVPDKYFDLKHAESKIINAFRARIGNTLDIKIEICQHISKTKNGKFKFVISNIETGVKK
ncbi:conserved protein of unknown function [Petrocella atlantisensis]|uniref:Uncharacterized protein n=1 Tax=Petrocella atlantisensis TaxID=2173034 RepID=A0A3P7PB93_9FIRM|nr:phenylacetate--CoA ligase family protein [Petrocella atlantisensis]VDN46178.1 conserved protein of unknown function [Petrocella atlantisensis]